MCKKVGRKVPANHIDHIIPISRGGAPLDLANLQSLCLSCHNRKTNMMDRGGNKSVPIKGCRVDGLPLDPDHWWNDGEK